MDAENKAVVLGANYYIGLSVIRCLGSHGVKVAAVDYSTKGTYGFRSRYCYENLVAPHYEKDPQGLLEFLIDYARKQDCPPVLFPCADPYVGFVDENLHVLRDYYLLPPMQQGLYTRVMNKGSLHGLAREHGVAVPETVPVDEGDYISRVESELGYPCLVKPEDSFAFMSRFRQKLLKVYNREELVSAVEKARLANLEVVLQRIIPGFDDCMHTFDAYLNRDSRVTHWMTCQKQRQFPVNYGASVYAIQKQVPELYRIGAGFLEAIGFKGFAEIEFKKDAETGRFYLIEVNVRTTNLNSLICKTGLHMAYLAYCELTGQFEEPGEPQTLSRDTGPAFWYAYEDMLSIRDYLRSRQLSLWDIIASFFRSKAYAIFSFRDPLPALTFLNVIAGRIRRKLWGMTKKEKAAG